MITAFIPFEEVLALKSTDLITEFVEIHFHSFVETVDQQLILARSQIMLLSGSSFPLAVDF